MRTSDTIDALAGALTKAQPEFAKIIKDRKVKTDKYVYTYADLGAVLDAVRPALSKHGLALVQAPTMDEGGHTALVSRLLHTSGQWIEATYPIAFTGRPQEIGSAITYARRYSISALLGIAAEDDDDGQAAVTPVRPAQTKQAAPSPAAKPVETSKGQAVEGGISDAQRKRFYAIAKQTGWTDDELRAWLMAQGIESTRHIPRRRYDELCTAVQAPPHHDEADDADYTEGMGPDGD